MAVGGAGVVVGGDALGALVELCQQHATQMAMATSRLEALEARMIQGGGGGGGGGAVDVGDGGGGGATEAR